MTAAGKPSIALRKMFISLALILGLAGPIFVTSWYTFELETESLAKGLRFELDRVTNVLANGMREPIWSLVPDMGNRCLIQSCGTSGS